MEVTFPFYKWSHFGLAQLKLCPKSWLLPAPGCPFWGGPRPLRDEGALLSAEEGLSGPLAVIALRHRPGFAPSQPRTDVLGHTQPPNHPHTWEHLLNTFGDLMEHSAKLSASLEWIILRIAIGSKSLGQNEY